MTIMIETYPPPLVDTPPLVDKLEVADPYPYGWRYVQRSRPDGSYDVEYVSLTLEDVLHPEEGDQVTHSDIHQRRIRYLCNIFEAALAGDETAVVLNDVRIKWDTPDIKAHGPDIMVILGVRERKNWSTFEVAEEGVRPALIIEVTSPETQGIDRSNKLEEYDLAGVPLYIMVDTVTRRRQSILRLLGYRQSATAYQPLTPNERGWLWLEPVRLWLGLEENELVCYNEAGQPLSDYASLATALTAAESRAQAEAQARAQAEARLRELEAELRQLRGEAAL